MAFINNEKTSFSSPIKAVFCTLLSVFIISVIDLFVKIVSPSHGVIQILFFKNLFGLLPFIYPIYKDFNVIKSTRIKEHFLRSILVLASTGMWFYSLSVLPFTIVYALSFSSPLFITILSSLILKEKVEVYSWIAIFVGLLAIMDILRPGIDIFSFKIFIPLFQVLIFSSSVVFIRYLTNSETDVSIVFYPTVFNLIACGFIVPFGWAMPSGINTFLLLGIGLLASGALLLKTHAYRLVPLSLTVPFEYTSILWAVFYDYMLENKILDLRMVLGITVVIIAGGYLLQSESRRNAESN